MRWTALVLCYAAFALEAAAQNMLPHQRLGVAPNTPPAELKRAYRKRCLELHPDKHKGEANKAWAEQEFMALGKAYETMLAEAVRRHQGASSRPTRAGSGGGTTGGEDRARARNQQKAHSRQQSDGSRQTTTDRERAERHRREQERRNARRDSGRSSGHWSERSSADTRRQREREREFRRLQEEERRWQEQARKRQQQQQQKQRQEQQHHQRPPFEGHARGGGDDMETRLRAEREQLERQERHRRELLRRQGGSRAGAHAGRQGQHQHKSSFHSHNVHGRDAGEGDSEVHPDNSEGRNERLSRQLHELAAGASLIATSLAEDGAWAAIGAAESIPFFLFMGFYLEQGSLLVIAKLGLTGIP